MLALTLRLFWTCVFGLHWHKWSMWKKINVDCQNGTEETMQSRRCETCGRFQTVKIYE